MSRMSNIDLTIKEFFTCLIGVFAIIVIVLCVYGQANIDIKKAQEKENRIIELEQRVEKQRHYIDKLVVDVDNLYRVVE